FADVVGKPNSGSCTPGGTITASGPVGTTNCWFNTSAFGAPPAPTVKNSGTLFQFGNEGRNDLRGPGLTVMNLSLAKDFSFTERVKLEVRADFVNALNHPSFNIPGQQLGGSNFGQINNSTLGNGVTVNPRSGQLSARISF
ncbi:MAG: hypothetical protein WA197_22215, partial [Candidatus Acidiferrales bacterium]